MEAKPPLQFKDDTSGGFVPRYRTSAAHIATCQTIAQLDGQLSQFHVHPQWLAQARRDAYAANSHASASIEGNPLSLEAATKILREYEATHRPRAPPDEREIIQHYEYYEHVRSLPLFGAPDQTVREIETAHARLLTGVLPDEKTPGRIRSDSNPAYVSIGRLECTPPERVQRELEALLDWFYTTALELPTPIRVALWFLEFESIHPFRDGNGRVGRALTHRLLCTDGLSNIVFVPLDRPFNEDRKSYYRALSGSQESERCEPWVGYFLDALSDTYRSTLETLENLAQAPQDLRGAPQAIVTYLLRSGRTTFRLEEIAPALPRYRPITLSLALTDLKKRGYLGHNGRSGKLSKWNLGPRLEEILKARTKR